MKTKPAAINREDLNSTHYEAAVIYGECNKRICIRESKANETF
jgi:hypothetical protein